MIRLRATESWEWVRRKMRDPVWSTFAVVIVLTVIIYSFNWKYWQDEKLKEYKNVMDAIDKTTYPAYIIRDWKHPDKNYWWGVATTPETPTTPMKSTKPTKPTETTKSTPEKTVICVVACGSDKLDETLVMIKSALVFSKKPLSFIVITEYKLISSFHEKLSEWQRITKKTFDFAIKPITYPKYVNENDWRNLFKPCASLRLFLPDVLKDIDSVLYVDTDTLFLTQPEKVWDVFNFMNSTQYTALVRECEDPNACWYPRFAKHPFVLPLGVNSGVMLMNLTKMREFKWTDYLVPIYNEYRNNITWGDQDIINIFFHFHPENLFMIDCRYNYRPDHCMYLPLCQEPKNDNGIIILHGSRGVFHNNTQPPFYAVYQAMSKYQLDTDSYEHLLLPIKSYLTQESTSACSKSWVQFFIRPELNLGKSDYALNYSAEDNGNK